MKDEKDSQNQDTSALELQIEQMIDELFVSREDPDATDQQGGPEAPAVEQGTFDFPTGTIGEEPASIEFGATGAPGLQVAQVTEAGQPTPERHEMEIEWGEGVPATGGIQSGGGVEGAFVGLGGTSDGAPGVQPSIVAEESAIAHLQPVTIPEPEGEQGRVFKAPDSPAQQLYNSLKENILSLEWEISPQNIERFLQAMRPVQDYLASNPSAIKAASMMVSVLNYIRRIGRSALPLSIQVLQNGVDFLGLLLLPQEQGNDEKRKEFLGNFVDHYRVLKYQIEQQRDKGQAPKAKAAAAIPGITPEITECIKGMVDDAVQSVVQAAVEVEIAKLKTEIMESLAQEMRVVPAPSVPVEVRETSKEEVLTVTLGDQHFNIPKALVANVYSPSPRKLAKVLENRSFRISDLLSFFGSATKGLLGGLATIPANELRSRSFDLVDPDKVFNIPGHLQPRQLVLISDGKKGFGFLADSAFWRSVSVSKDFIERIVSGAEGSNSVLQNPEEEHPFLNVAKEL